MGSRIDDNEFKKQIFNLVGGEYTFIEQYKGAKQPIMVKHNLCGHEYLVTPDNFKRNRRCPECKKNVLSKLKRLPYEYVKNYIAMAGYVLLSMEYNNNYEKLEILCNEGHVYFAAFSNFTEGKRCPFCSGHMKLTFKYVSEYIESAGHTLLSDKYMNNREMLLIECDKGHIYKQCFSNLQKGHWCPICGNKRKGIYAKHSYEYVYKYLEENGCELLEKEYKDCKTKMKYRCSCGNESYTTFMLFQLGCRCDNCKRKKISDKLKYSYEEVYNYFKECGCELLESQYINSWTLMRYRCSCGNISYTTLNRLKSGCRCNACSKSKGEDRIEHVLLEHELKPKIDFIRQYKFWNCRKINCLKYDVAIFNKDRVKCLIEYDGIQHYEVKNGFNTLEDLKELQENDRIKTKYCEDNHLKLIRIPYWDYDNIKEILINAGVFQNK